MSYWEYPLLISSDSFTETWSRPCQQPVLFVAGSGFDPRATAVLERLVNDTDRRVDGLMIALPEDATDLAVRPLALANQAQIAELILNTGDS